MIVDYRPITRQAHAALWQVLLGMDLFPTIESWQLPVDDPLPFLLTDYRQVRTVAEQGRPVAAAGRPAGAAGRLAGTRSSVEAVLEVSGERVRADRRPGRRRVHGRPTGRPRCGWTGPSSARSIWAATGCARWPGPALARVDDPALLDRLDLAFGTDRAPRYGTNF